MVEESGGDQVRETVVGVLLGEDQRLVALLRDRECGEQRRAIGLRQGALNPAICSTTVMRHSRSVTADKLANTNGTTMRRLYHQPRRPYQRQSPFLTGTLLNVTARQR